MLRLLLRKKDDLHGVSSGSLEYLREHEYLSITHQHYMCVLFCRFKITTEKPTGAIAGVQRMDGGPIEWGYRLPHSCQLSQYVT